MDRRQRKTRQAIFSAFASLLEKKDYRHITVQDIIDEADIGRSTFYAHFETKDALLKALCREIFEHVFSDELMKEGSHDFSTSHRDLHVMVTHLLYHIKDNRSFIKSILSGESQEIFMRYFKDYLTQMFTGTLEATSELPEDYLMHHLVSDFAESVRWWMTNEHYTPEDIARFYFATMPIK